MESIKVTTWIDIGIVGEIDNQGYKIVEVDDRTIAIFNLEGLYFAFEDNCPHQHLPLADGLVCNDTITCPYHGAVFNIKTGAVLAPPACSDLHTYPTRVLDDKIQINI